MIAVSSSSKRAAVKRPSVVDRGRRAPQIVRAVDAALGDVVVDLDEIPGGPREARRQRLDLHFVAPLHAPAAAAAIADRHARLRSAEVLLDEDERRLGRAVPAAGPGGEVERLHWPRVAPDARARRSQAALPGAPDLHYRASAPEREDRERRGDGRRGDDDERL